MSGSRIGQNLLRQHVADLDHVGSDAQDIEAHGGQMGREQPVLAIWEGSGNVIALDVLRALTRDADAAAALADELAQTRGASAMADAHTDRALALMDELAAHPSDGPGEARRLSEMLALALQASLMLRYAPTVAAEAFIAARLGPDRCAQYGVLPRGVPASIILGRH